jgi:hypothetical protein
MADDPAESERKAVPRCAEAPAVPRAQPFWRRQFAGPLTPQQRAFDVLFGAILPLLCVVVDPVLFGGFGMLSRKFGDYEILWWTFIGLEIVCLVIWLAWGRHLSSLSALFSGGLLVGALFSFAVGLVLLPIAAVSIYAVMWADPLAFPLAFVCTLGLAPFFSSFVYYRQGRRAYAQARRSVGLLSLLCLLLGGAGAIPLGAVAIDWKITHPYPKSFLGAHWVRATDSLPLNLYFGYENFASVVHDGKIWLIDNTPGGKISSSADGVAWHEVSTPPWPRGGEITAFSFEGKLWIFGGPPAYRNDQKQPYVCFAWSSTDGKAWNSVVVEEPWTEWLRYAGLVYDRKMWLLGKADYGLARPDIDEGTNVVWWSTDGAHWRSATAKAPWRSDDHDGVEAVVHDDKMWVLTGPRNFGRVHWSTDGATWNQVSSNAPTRLRSRWSLVSHAGRMWLMGGYIHPAHRDAPEGRKNDVWFSADGFYWSWVTLHAGWSPRAGHSCLSFEGKLWIAGGRTDGAPCRDIWWSAGRTGHWWLW